VALHHSLGSSLWLFTTALALHHGVIINKKYGICLPSVEIGRPSAHFNSKPKA
jgi:hypothetical protein